MASHPLLDFIRRLRRARSVAEGGHLTDAQLLERFAKLRDEAAFEVLVWRHGALVLNVARRLLRQTADAEDVFQATFLTLARKASAIRRGTSLGSWLYKVAYRLALRARQAAVQRQRYGQPGIEIAIAPVEYGDAELSAALAQEVDRLPERYRAVVVLCYLQGATTEQASRLLGCPRGTVLSRLASARQRLRQRLMRRGIAPAAALAQKPPGLPINRFLGSCRCDRKLLAGLDAVEDEEASVFFPDSQRPALGITDTNEKPVFLLAVQTKAACEAEFTITFVNKVLGEPTYRVLTITYLVINIIEKNPLGIDSDTALFALF